MSTASTGRLRAREYSPSHPQARRKLIGQGQVAFMYASTNVVFLHDGICVQQFGIVLRRRDLSGH